MRTKLAILAATLVAVGAANAGQMDVGKFQLQTAQTRAAIVSLDIKTKRAAHTEAEFTLLALDRMELAASRMALDGSQNNVDAFNAARIDFDTAFKQFKAAVQNN